MSELIDVKIAETPEIAFWTKLKDESIKRVESNKHEIIINESIIKLADEKLAENKNGK